MIKHITHREIDKKKWDVSIANAGNSLIYAYSWYLDIVSPGWEALIEGDYQTLMPLTLNKKYGIPYLYQPFFTQQLGIFSPETLTENKTGAFLEALPPQFKLIEINLNTSNETKNSAFYLRKNTSFKLNLAQPYSTIVQKYSENTKRNIKKAQKQGLVLRKNADPKKIIRLFRHNRGKKIETLSGKHYLLLEKLLEELIKRDAVQILSVETANKELSAGAFFIESGVNAVFLFSGSDEGSRENGAMFYLIDRFISENAQRLYTLDFNGSNNPNLARFYSGFGSLPQTYSQIRKNNLPWLIRWLKKH